MTPMDTDGGEGRYDGITQKIIGCAYRVHGVLGPGFLEKVYENALVHELKKAGLAVRQQVRLDVWYDGVAVGDYVADLLVEDVVLVELKVAKAIEDAHIAVAINYCTAARLPLCLVLNFGQRVGVRRVAGPSLRS